MHRFLGSISFALLLLTSFYSSSLYANVTSVTATPATVTVPAKGSANVNITWLVTRTPATLGAVTVSSANALLQIQGVTVATLGTTLSRGSNIAVGADMLRFTETLLLNAALTRRIADSPAGSVRIIRNFDDQQLALTGQVRVAAGQNNNVALTVRRIDLSFDSKARTDVIHQGDSLRAIVDISFRSSGVLRGEWRLIDPSASLGKMNGRVLQVIQKNLVSSGEGRTRIISPPLPSQQTGLYLLAFAIDQTEGIEIPVLRYFVLDKKRNSINEMASITTLSPTTSRTQLSNDTRFAWQPIEQAHAYQVVIFYKGDTVPISGKLVTGKQSELTLADFSRERLSPGYEYIWRVRAFDQQGNMIASSAASRLYLPE